MRTNQQAISDHDYSISAIWARLNQISNASGQVVLTTGTGGTTGAIRTKGQATIANGTSSIVVTHGAGLTPLLQDIFVTLSNNPTTQPGEVWVDTITSTQFTVHCATVIAVGSLTFGWTVLLA